MGKLTQAGSAAIKKILHRMGRITADQIGAAICLAFILGVIFDLFGVNYRYITSAPWGNRFFALVMLLFVNMIHEDLVNLVVDIRKSILLLLGLGICSNKSIQEFAILTGIGIFIFYLSYLSQLKFVSHSPQPLREEQSLPEVGFLPCFGAALFLFFIASCGETPLNTMFGELNKFDIATYLLLYIVYAKPAALYCLLFVFGIIFVLLIGRYWYNRKKGRICEKEGIGAGDVSFLPAFFAFLGSLDFTVVFFMANVIVIMVHHNITKYQNYKKWRKENGN